MTVIRAKQIDGNGDTPAPEEDPRLSWSVILDAPEVASFLKTTETPRAKEYRNKTNSLLNTVLQARLGSPNGLADVSAILQRGPATAIHAGTFADNNESFRRMLDVITAPDNPAVAFAVTAIPLVMQVLRNHEADIQDVKARRAARRRMSKDERKTAKAAKPRVEFKFMGRTWKMPFTFKVNIGNMLRMNTVPPDYLVSSVIGDPKVRAELSKRYGVKWDGPPAS